MDNLLHLKKRMVTIVLIILISIFSISSVLIIERESNLAEEFFIKNNESFARLSVVYIINSYELYYESGFYKFSEIIDTQMSSNKNIDKIQILDVNGKILFDSNEIEFGKYNDYIFGDRIINDDSIVKRAGSATSSTSEISGDENFLEIIQPYNEEWGRHDYSIRYLISLSNMEKMIQEIVSIVILYSVILFLITFSLIYYLFNRFIFIPFREIIRDSDKNIRKKH